MKSGQKLILYSFIEKLLRGKTNDGMKKRKRKAEDVKRRRKKGKNERNRDVKI